MNKLTNTTSAKVVLGFNIAWAALATLSGLALAFNTLANIHGSHYNDSGYEFGYGLATFTPVVLSGFWCALSAYAYRQLNLLRNRQEPTQ